ncbi:hypothetical protein BU17DRAFT_71813 [Hysterangium stoloniferum]|nr:hypothetical protein BU17DRAFT_71813 [Hysterangium stoloniferum]
MSRVENISKEKLSSDVRLEQKTRAAVHSEVMQELERYPIIERAVSEVAALNDEALLTSIEEYVRNILQGESNGSTKLWNAQPSRPKTGDENDDSSDYSEDEDGAEDGY